MIFRTDVPFLKRIAEAELTYSDGNMAVSVQLHPTPPTTILLL